MKKKIVVVLCSMMFVLMIQEGWAGLPKTKIAVLDFKVLGKGHTDTEMGQVVAKQFISALQKDWRFEIVDLGLIEKVIREQQLVLDKKEHRLIVTDLAKVLGARVLISGFVMKYHDVVEMNVRVINVDNATIIAAESAKSQPGAPLERMTDQLVEKVIKIFPLKGIIVFRAKDRITIDLGRCDGIKSGMHFAVFKEHKVIRCPETRRVIDCARTQTGIFEIENVKDKISIARVLVEKAPGAIARGQLVESAEKLLVPEGCSQHQ